MSRHIPLHDKVMQRVALLSLQVVVQPLVSDVRVPNLLEDDCAEPVR